MVSKMHFSVRLLIILAVSLAIILDTTSVSANTRYYEHNNILYYSKDATEPATCTPGASFSTTTKLPDKTIKNLESQKVKEKAEKNKSSYQKAEKATGVPWTMLATLHFREAGMDSGRSLSNGEPITGTKYKNKADGVWVGANLDEDAILAAQHFIEMASAKDLYKIDVTKANLTTEEIGFVQGTVGIIGLTLGGILGGIAVARNGLKQWLWPMVWAISLPDLVYVYLSYIQPDSLYLINICIFIEQFGYGFGFTAYMLYLIYFADGEHKTAHYAICTAFMALGMMIPGMAAGWLQEQMGYTHFFIWIMICCVITFGVTALLKIDPEFGKKKG